MQTRLVKDFVNDLIQVIANLPKDNVDIQSLPEDKRALAVLLQLEAKLFFDALARWCQDNASSTKDVSATNLESLYHLLRERLQVYRKTDAMYFISPHSRVNQACLSLANLLPKSNGEHPYTLLFNNPSDAMQKLKLHEFILRDDDEALSIEQSYDYLLKKAEHERSQTSGVRAGRLSRPRSQFQGSMGCLTLEEEHLVSRHSKEAEKYFDAIKLNADVNETQQAFLTALHGDAYKVTASFGEEGRELLLNGVLRNVTHPFTFVTFMFENIPKEHWLVFLSAIKKEDLIKTISGVDIKELRKKAANDDEFNKLWPQEVKANLLKFFTFKLTFKTVDHLRAFMFCLNEVYLHTRNVGPDFDTTFGQYVGSFFAWAHSKQDKISACQIYRDFILSDTPIPNLSELEKYLRARNLYEKHWGPLTTTANANVSNNLLATLTSMADQVDKTIIMSLTSAVCSLRS